MIDMLKNAKDLIAKGKTLNDPELVQMGMDLLEQYSPTESVATTENKPEEEYVPMYNCSNCGMTMPVDKEGRKRCPDCKKHKLYIQERPTPPPLDNTHLIDVFEQQQRAPQMDDFHMQVRQKDTSRIHYDDTGNPDGIIRRIEEVDPNSIHNVWQDDGEDGHDPVNEKLKQFTKVSPRTRAPTRMVEVQCESCNRIEKLHPIHAGGRGRHLCVKCIGRRSQR